MNKTIHVNSYVKRDGTQVREHYRTIDSDGFDYDDPNYEDPYYNPEPIPGREHTIEQTPMPEKRIDWGEIGSVLFNVVLIAGKVLSVLQKSNAASAAEFKPQVDNAVKEMKTAQIKADDISKEYLKKLSNAKGEEFKNLLKNYQEQKSIADRIKQKIAKIEYASENNRYDAIIEELKNFQSDFDDVMKRTRETRPLNKIDWQKEMESSGPVSYSRYLKHYTPNYEAPILPKKKMIDAGTCVAQNFPSIKNASNFWRASSHDFKHSKKYINQNGYLVYSVNDLPTKELKRIVAKKNKEQFGEAEQLGIVFKPQSDISKLIAQSEEIKEFYKKYINKLLNGEIVNSSLYFDDDWDLKLSLGHADIIFAHVNKYGYLELIILDTYDFNKNDPNWIVKIVRQVEDASIIREYYTLILVEIDLYTLIKTILEEKYDNLIYE